ncbi:MAG: class I SAM-dependent methyltransferase [Polyangiaceae bacterium]
MSDVEIQRKYYADTAHRYNELHVHEQDEEHRFALAFMTAAIQHLGVSSVLDVGSGTGRALLHLKASLPDLRVVGVEPVAELRAIGHEAGLSEQELIAGDATHLDFSDGSFDLVCEFGVLHHIRRPELAVAEMLRVSEKAIFISDSNNFGQGSRTSRTAKQLLDFLGLWRVADLVKTRGKGYTLSEGDGLSYSYSVFNNYEQIAAACRRVHLLNTRDGAINPYRSASHVALLGVK